MRIGFPVQPLTLQQRQARLVSAAVASAPDTKWQKSRFSLSALASSDGPHASQAALALQAHRARMDASRKPGPPCGR